MEGAPGEERAVARLFTERPIRDAWFASTFLRDVPVERLSSMIDALIEDFGPFLSARIRDGAGTVRLERARVPLSVRLEGDRIAALLVQPPEPVEDGMEEPAALVERMGTIASGTFCAWAGERTGDGAWRTHASVNADRPMAVGSAFKLAVLRAYEDAVTAGTLERAAVVALTEADRSLPTGVLQAARAGTPVTVESLAALMIQHSDNTATDALMRVLERERVEAVLLRNRPCLFTAELFKLIARGNGDWLDRFRAGDARTRRAVLGELASVPLPDASDILSRPTWKDAEWFATATELRDLLASLRRAPALNGAPNPLVAVAGWPWVGFKGGSEFGVLNLSAAAEAPDGRTICAVVTANGPARQPEERLAFLFANLLRVVAATASASAAVHINGE